MRALVLSALFVSACSFSPSIDGEPLVDCTVAEDCPRGGICVSSVCVSQPLAILSLTATPPVVEAGESCTLAVEAVHAQKPERLRYVWHQILGPRVGLDGQGTAEIQLETEASYIGSYEVEVTVSNDIDPPATGRVHCTAMVTEDDAYVVLGHTGDCTRESPCGTLNEANLLVPLPQRIYVGLDGGSSEIWYLQEAIDFRYDGRELHAGYVFPDWVRDRTRSQIALAGWRHELLVSCDNCLLSGIVQRRIFAGSHDGIDIVGNDVTLREVDLIIEGGSLDASITALGAANSSARPERMVLEGIRIEIGDGGLIADRLEGIELAGEGSRLADAVIDFTAAEADLKTGLLLYGHWQGNSRPVVERVAIRTGGADAGVTGILVANAAPTVHNAIVDVRGGGPEGSSALAISPLDDSQPDGARFHSSIFVGGDSQTSHALWLAGFPRSFSFVNCILDAGNGWGREAIHIHGDQLRDDATYDFSGTVLVLDGGEGDHDDWGVHHDISLDLDELETLLDCVGCFATSSGAGHQDREHGDFHLTNDSTCCIDSGVPLEAGDPREDFDGVSRPAQSPAVGPYQYIP